MLEVINASIRSSPLWHCFQVRRLIHPVRNAADPEFAAYVDLLGDGAGPDVPLLMLPITDRAEDLVDFAFPPHVIANPGLSTRRAILAPTNKQVIRYNNLVLDRVDGVARTYTSTDSIKEVDDVGLMDIDPDALIRINQEKFIHGMPPHRLQLKTKSACRILRNMSISRDLVRNVRVVVVDVGNRIVTIRRLRDGADGSVVIDGEDVLLPRIPFLHVLPSGHTLVRRQFPIDLAYSTTFNGCQGLTLDKVAVDLTQPAFSHGQLYTALSRIRKREEGMVRTENRVPITKNITFREILL